MDNSILIHIAKASLSLMLFYIIYKMLLSKDTFFNFRRIFFLFAIFASVVYPFILFEIPESIQYAASQNVAAFTVSLLENPADFSNDIRSSFSFIDFLFLISIIGSAFLLIQFFIHLTMIVRLYRNNDVIKKDNFYLIKVDKSFISPFSFFNFIFINMHDNPDSQERIIMHELTHVRQCHSLDILMMEIICIAFWWNPFVWLLKKEMKINLEYLADKSVLNEGYDKKDYQYLLLENSIKNTGIYIVNNFNVSQLKKRINMMNKKRSSSFASVRYLLAIPLFTLLLLFNNVHASDYLDIISESHSLQDSQPEYSGGQEAMWKFMAQNIRYPQTAVEQGITGIVKVSYDINEDGTVSNIKPVQKLDENCDKEVMRVVGMMPKWQPAEVNGKKVKSGKEFSVKFMLTDKDGNKIDAASNEDSDIVVVGYK